MPKRNSLKLTINVLKEASCPAGKEYETRWDNEIIGFGLRSYPSGTKAFVFSYRLNGQKRTIVIGKFGNLTLDQARNKAKGHAAKIANGEDPLKEKRAKIENNKRTVSAIAEQYLEEHANKKKKPRSAARDESLFRLHILPKIGSMPITSVTRQDIKKLHHDIGETAEVIANRAIALLSKFFNLTEEWGYRAENSNPCKHVNKFREYPRERTLTDDELSRLGAALNRLEAENPDRNTPLANMIRLLVYTGARLGEIINARWCDLDSDHKNLLVMESKTGRKVIPLSSHCRMILNSIKPIEGNPYILTGNGKNGRLGDIYRFWTKLLKMAEIEGLRIHDLRHNFASRGAKAGHSLYLIGSALGHSNPSTTQRYAHITETPLQQLVNTVGADIASAFSQNHKSAEVVAINQAG